MADSSHYAPPRCAVAPDDIAAVAAALRKLRKEFRYSEFADRPSAITARHALVDELLEYLETRGVG